MSSELDEARLKLDGQWSRHIGGLFGRAPEITAAVEALIRAVIDDHIIPK